LDLDLGFGVRYKICILDLDSQGFVDLVLDLVLDLFSHDTNPPNRFGDFYSFLLFLK